MGRAPDAPDARASEGGAAADRAGTPQEQVGFTAEERGDTVGRGRRALVRIAVALVILGGIGATVAVSNGVPQRVSAFVGGALAGVQGLVGIAPATATVTATATAAGATASADPAAGETGDAAADTASDPAATAAPVVADPAQISGDKFLLDTIEAAEATARPTSTLAPYPVDEGDVVQGRLVAVHDLRWTLLARDGAFTDQATAATVQYLGARATAYTLDDLIALGAATRESDTRVLVTKSVFVARGASLDIEGAGQTLALASGTTGFVPIVVWGGTLTLHGADGAPLAITSWDTAAGAPDSDVTDGRAYIRVNEGTVSVDWVAASDLGFWSGRTGGFALTGSGLAGSTGSITHSTFARDHIGLYLASSTAVAIGDSTISDSVKQGIEIASNTSGIDISGTTVTRSGSTGVDVRSGAVDLSVTTSTLSGNSGYGLRFDGVPRADGATAAGYSVENGWGLTLSDSTLSGNRAGGASVLGTSDVVVSGNTVEQRALGLALRDSQASVTGNTVAVSSGQGLLFEGPLTSARAAENVISGEGPAAIALRDGAEDVVQEANDESGWSERWEIVLWVEAHPLALLWALLLVIPVVGIAFVFYRMRRQRTIRELVESATIALARAEKERYESARMPEPALAGGAASGAAGSVTSGSSGPGTAAGMATASSVPEGRPVRSSGADGSGGQAGTGRVAGSGSRPAVGSSPSAPAGSRSTAGDASRAASASASPAAGSAGSAGGRAGAVPATRGVPPRSGSPRPPSSRPGTSVAAGAPGTSGAGSASGGAAGYGRFSSVEELAVAAVLDAGKPIDRVAHALRVPVGSVAGWVAKARRQREAAERPPGA